MTKKMYWTDDEAVPRAEYDALAAQMAEMRQAMDELHVKHGRSMRGIDQREARLLVTERLLSENLDARQHEAARLAEATLLLQKAYGMGWITDEDLADEISDWLADATPASAPAVCQHGIRHPWECRECADAAWEKHKADSASGGCDASTSR